MNNKDLELVRELVAEEHGLCVVAIAESDGSNAEDTKVHASVVNAGVLEHPLTGKACVGLVARGNSKKLVLLRRAKRATVIFRHGWQWVGIEGRAEIAGPDDTLQGFEQDALPALIRDIFVAAGGTHDNFDEFDRVMALERRAAVLVAVEHVLKNRTT